MTRNAPRAQKESLKTRWLSGMLAVILLACLVPCALDVNLKTVRYTVKSDKIAAPVKICVIADLHSSYYGADQSDLIKAIHGQNPDIIVFTGDICDNHIPHDGARALLEAVAGEYPCFYVAGNHEFWSFEMDNIREIFASYGVVILRGDCETVEINGNLIDICGLDDPDCDWYEPGGIPYAVQFDMLENAADGGNFTILLAHRPERIGEYSGHGFDLVLSGHAHGGQWRLPGIINGVYAPDQGFFPRYAGGRYSFGGTEMIVSRGLSMKIKRPPRIFNPPELVIVMVTPIDR